MDTFKIKTRQNHSTTAKFATEQAGKKKTCQNCKTSFFIEKEDFEFYNKISVPEPTFCPECRMIRRMVWRTNMNLYKRKVEGIENETLSYVAPNSPFKVYDYKAWWSDELDEMKKDGEYDFSKPFFQQIRDLMLRVGLPHLNNVNAINSDFCNNTYGIKNCYLVFNCGLSENCAYGTNIESSKDCYSNAYLTKCELCHEGLMLAGCYKTYFSSYCAECQEVFYSLDCVNCQNCFGCVGLRHKKYYIFNKKYDKKSYFEELRKYNLGSYKKHLDFEKTSKIFWSKFPVRFMHGRKNDNVIGEDIYNSKNVINSHSIKDGEEMKHCQLILFWRSKQCYDITVAGGELCYELEEAGGYNAQFCWLNLPKDLKNNDAGLYNMEYSIGNYNCHDLFGCVGLRHKSYCVFNRQYTKKQYEDLVPRIKKQMNEMPFIDKQGIEYKYGEFFPLEMSPFAYNETIAQEYFPLTKVQAIKKGYRWYDKPKSDYSPTIKAKDLPDNINDANEDILKEIIECDSPSCHGSGVFRLIPSELAFYKKHCLPLPRLCPDCRHSERIKQRNPLKLYKRQCMCDGKVFKNQGEHEHGDKPCPNTFETTYAPDRREIVYCRACYQKEVE